LGVPLLFDAFSFLEDSMRIPRTNAVAVIAPAGLNKPFEETIFMLNLLRLLLEKEVEAREERKERGERSESFPPESIKRYDA
jgi:hypothetical protein